MSKVTLEEGHSQEFIKDDTGTGNNMRSVLENPKKDQKITINIGNRNGILTSPWHKKIVRFVNFLIPSHISKDNQIWLSTPEELLQFIDNLQKPDFDLSSIEYVCITHSIAYIYDIIDFLNSLKRKLPQHAKLIYANFNWLLSPIFKLSSVVGLSRKGAWGNFYRDEDLDCFFAMAGWENIRRLRRYLLPFQLGWLSAFFDAFVRLPFFSYFALNTIFIARIKPELNPCEHSVSILIPCKNEEGNIEAVVKRFPSFGKSIELIFINDKSVDKTEQVVLRCKEAFPEKNIKLVQGLGHGKGEAVRSGMQVATGDICMILDADLSVIPEDLPQFYESINSGRADFLNGTRLVYPQEEEAMKSANILGNIFFSIAFSYVLDQRITDTLCGTKVFWRRDWPIFEEMRMILKNIDVWGDYNLIFGAARFGLKIGELPVRYFQRLKGVTKMTKRIKNGLIMLRVVWYALWKLKFIG